VQHRVIHDIDHWNIGTHSNFVNSEFNQTHSTAWSSQVRCGPVKSDSSYHQTRPSRHLWSSGTHANVARTCSLSCWQRHLEIWDVCHVLHTNHSNHNMYAYYICIIGEKPQLVGQCFSRRSEYIWLYSDEQ